MKTLYPKLILLVIALFQFNVFSIAQLAKDTSQVRYVKFSTTVSADFTQISLQEIETYYDGLNIAPGNAISASSKYHDSDVTKVIDGNSVSAWTSDEYSWLTSDDGVGPTWQYPHTIIVDLDNTFNLQSLNLDIDAMGFDYSFDFFVSENAVDWSLVDSKTKTHGNYTYTNIPIQNVRYIKYACYYSSDDGQVNVQEIQAYSNGVNVALNKSVTANSYEWGNASNNGHGAVDGDPGSRWSSSRYDYTAGTSQPTAAVDVTLDFGEVLTVDSLVLHYASATVFTLSVSDDGVNWLQIGQQLNNRSKHKYVLNRSINITTSVTAFTNTSATCTTLITSSGGSTITERGLCWSTSANPTVLDNKITNGGGMGSFATTITELSNNTVYYVRSYATNATETKYSKEQRFLVGLTVQTTVLSNANSSVTSGGYISAEAGVQVTERGVCWGTTKQPTIANDHSSDGTGAGEFSSNLSALTYNTKYYVRAYATTSLGTFYGKAYSFAHQALQYQAIGGYYDGEIFSQSGTSNDHPYFTGSYGNTLEFDSYNWVLAGWITNYDSGNPPLTGWDYGMELAEIITLKASASYDIGSLKESSFNDGSFTKTITITHDNVGGATFTGVANEDFIETEKAIVRNLPTGLRAKIVRNSSLTLTLSITGVAVAHSTLNNVSNVKVMLLPQAFTDGNTVLTAGNSKTLSLDFIEPINITVEGSKNCSEVGMTADNNVTLDNNSTLTVSTHREMNQLIINAGAKLNLTNTVTLNDVILKADDSNSFSAKLGTCMTVNGTVTFQKTMLDTKWYFLSFPCNVNVADIVMIGGGVVGVDFYIQTYNGSTRATNGLGGNWNLLTNGVLEAKKGYAFGLKTNGGTKTLSFVLDKSIAECETAATVPATFYDGSLSTNHKGWNLIGQPYLSKFAGSDVGINFLTTWNGSAYVGQTNSLVNSLNPFEAFFVQVAATSPISFSLDGRQAVRSVVNQNLQECIELTMVNSAGTDISTLLFDNDQSEEYVIGHDLEKWISTEAEKPQIYSQLNGVKYAYNALPINNTQPVAIGYYSKLGGISTIRASKVNITGLSKLLLIDNQTNTSTDLMHTSYSFKADAGTNNSRFSVVPQYISTNITEKSANGKPVIYSRNLKLTISNLIANSTIRLYDATGKMIHTAATNGNNSYEIALTSNGLYVVQIDSNTGSWNYKLTTN